MSKLLSGLAALALLVVIALPGSADAARRAEGVKNLGEDEVSAQYRRRYVRPYGPRRYVRPYGPRRIYVRRYYGPRYYRPRYYAPRYYARPYYRPYRYYWGTPWPFFWFGY